ncbi:MAG: response regulator [Myxococcales bacterium]|nr:MAG: response regulator [Myxococcales bacterium]
MTAEKAKTILIVDDEPDVVTYLSSYFADQGYAVLTAKNGHEGFDLAKSKRPDLITLDITMPEESGVRMFRNLQENDATKNIPVVMITGITKDFKGFIEHRKVVRPPEAYFEKPVDKDELLAKVRELIG